MYVFQMFDYQAGGISLVLIAFLEAVGIGWFYGEKLMFILKKRDCKKMFLLFFHKGCIKVILYVF